MRVVHITSVDNGGAGRACIRLHKALLEAGVDSIIITQNKTTDTPKVQQLAQTKLQKLVAKIRPFLSQLPLMAYPKRVKDIFSPNIPIFTPSNHLLISTINALKPDIVHLHWVENGFFSTKDLQSIQAPMLWSLHDANPYTGGCHYVAAACVGVGTRCKSCPLLQSALPFDLSFWTFKRKAKTYAKLKNLTINGLSRWIAQSAKDSALLGSKPIINLPNPIDTRIYRPIQKSLAREMLRIHTPKKMISFGAIGATSTPRKGFSELKVALQSLPQHLKSQCELLVFGSSEGEVLHDMPTHFLGALHDDIALALLYSASDVFIMPSYVESFGQTALEALSCGTPVVAFDTSGLKDIITHKHNGYLAKCYDTNDLAKGMEWILSGESAMYENLSNNARSSAIKAFESSKVANAYITTYQKLARGGAAPKALAKHILHALSLTKSSTFYIGFGAIGGASVERKGFNELKAALDCLPQHLKNQCELLVFGGTAPQIQGIKAHALGFLHDDYALSFAFNACDIFVAPSLAENLSNVIMESLACGTPVVAFDIGGNGDMITHKHNGYLATNPSDLAQGIKWILAQDATAYATLAHNARESALRFESTKVANTYIDTYKFLAGGGSNHRFLKVLLLSQAHRNSQHNFFSNISSTGLAA